MVLDVFYYLVVRLVCTKNKTAFGLQVHLAHFFHYSEPSKQSYYLESRLLMDYSFEKLTGCMFYTRCLSQFLFNFSENIEVVALVFA